MNITYQRLKNEHARLLTLVEVLEEELVRVDQGGEPNYVLLGDCMDYLCCYPETFHHPIEEKIMNQLAVIEPASRELIKTLNQEHLTLKDLGQRVSTSCRAVAQESLFPWEEIRTELAAYAALMREHILHEDNEALPLAEQLLPDEMWPESSSLENDDSDPLFGKVVADGYRNLYHHIINRGS